MTHKLSCFILSIIATLALSSAHADGPARESSTPGQAQPGEAARTVHALLHQPQEVRELPAPGRPVKLRTMVTNTKSIVLPVSALVVRDGRLVQLPLKGQLDDLERAIYSVDVPAPVGELAYQFVLTQPDLPAVVSMRYSTHRECLPGTNLADAYTPLDYTTVEGRRDLILRARGLERDLNHYDTVISLLTELKSHVTE